MKEGPSRNPKKKRSKPSPETQKKGKVGLNDKKDEAQAEALTGVNPDRNLNERRPKPWKLFCQPWTARKTGFHSRPLSRKE